MVESYGSQTIVNECDLLFSVNTLLAYAIAQKYYNQVHYAWFTTKFDYGNKQPASANPRSICHDLLEAIASNDHHCEKISRIQAGILFGAYDKRKKCIIDEDQEMEIRALVNQSCEQLDLLLPIVYVASWQKAARFCESVDRGDKASPDSVEFLSRELPRTVFDIVDMKKLLFNIDCFERLEIG